jgi:hypothetical protein
MLRSNVWRHAAQLPQRRVVFTRTRGQGFCDSKLSSVNEVEQRVGASVAIPGDAVVAKLLIAVVAIRSGVCWLSSGGHGAYLSFVTMMRYAGHTLPAVKDARGQVGRGGP